MKTSFFKEKYFINVAEGTGVSANNMELMEQARKASEKADDAKPEDAGTNLAETQKEGQEAYEVWEEGYQEPLTYTPYEPEHVSDTESVWGEPLEPKQPEPQIMEPIASEEEAEERASMIFDENDFGGESGHVVEVKRPQAPKEKTEGIVGDTFAQRPSIRPPIGEKQEYSIADVLDRAEAVANLRSADVRPVKNEPEDQEERERIKKGKSTEEKFAVDMAYQAPFWGKEKGPIAKYIKQFKREKPNETLWSYVHKHMLADAEYGERYKTQAIAEGIINKKPDARMAEEEANTEEITIAKANDKKSIVTDVDGIEINDSELDADAKKADNLILNDIELMPLKNKNNNAITSNNYTPAKTQEEETKEGVTNATLEEELDEETYDIDEAIAAINNGGSSHTNSDGSTTTSYH